MKFLLPLNPVLSVQVCCCRKKKILAKTTKRKPPTEKHKGLETEFSAWNEWTG